MAHPRRILVGETYLLTRRCSHRAFRLRPSRATNQIFLYCLAFAAWRTGVAVHAVCVMSNHHHLIVTDRRGALPEFLRELHRLTAKAINALQGQWENLWAAEPCNAVRLVTDADVEDKLAYVVANPVAAGLVESPELWPGVLLWDEQKLRIARPPWYFREDGECPEVLELRVEPPARRQTASSDSTWTSRVRGAIAEKVTAAHRLVRRAGGKFLGRAKVLATSFWDKARSHEARFGLIPTFAALEEWVRVELLRSQRAFRAAYREAFERWRTGTRSAQFPPGTWSMAVVHGLAVSRDAEPWSLGPGLAAETASAETA